jgi:type II restriction/modification system DNA methylase subunit YeeA
MAFSLKISTLMIRGYLLSDYVIDEIKNRQKGIVEKFKNFSEILEDIKGNDYNEADLREKIIKILEILGWSKFEREHSISNLMRIDIVANNKIIVECKRKGTEFDKKELNNKSPAKQIRNYLFDEEVKKSANFGILTDGIKFRIYYANKLSDYIEFDFEEISEDDFKVFYYLLNEKEFPDNFLNALNENYYYQTKVSDELLKNVFESVIPLLAEEFNKKEKDLKVLKRHILIFLFRLLFIFYAEDRNLIDLKGYSLKDIRKNIKNFKSSKTYEIFNRIKTIFKLINEGDKEINLPRYNGGLFKDNDFYNDLEISDKVMSEIIYKLSYFQEKFINYKDISVRHLGSIYETILEFDLKKEKDSFYLEKGKERKISGVYYTPDFVVNFIIERTIGRKIKEILNDFEKNVSEIEKMNKSELLKKFRMLKLDVKKKLADSYRDKTEKEMKEELKNYYDPIERILNLKILDLASGSGHFLVSAVEYLSNKIEEVEYILEKKYNYKSPFFDKLEKIKNEIVNYSKHYNFNIKKEQIYDENLIKRVILKRCIYGVDINELAVELTKISLWLFSFTIGAPLSFLDHHIKAGNSIIGTGMENKSLFSSDILQQAKTIFEEINELYDITDIEESYKMYSNFEEFISEKRKDLNYRLGYKEELKPFHFILEFPDAIDGFDIIISNPPYVRQERIRDIKSYLEKDFKEVYSSTADIYVYFYYRAMELLKNNGYLGFITSNKFFRAKYGENLRNFLSSFKILDVIDFGGYKVFKSATVDTCIMIIKKEKIFFENNINALTINDNSIVFEDGLTIEEKLKFKEKGKKIYRIKDYFEANCKIISQKKNFSKNIFLIADDKKLQIKEKIEKIGKPLKNWDVKIYRGILTGYNEAFIINTETRNRILANCKDEKERKRTEEIIKPILRGRDIKKYYYKWAGLWVIIIPAGWTNKNKAKKQGEEFFKETFSSLYNYFISFVNVKGKGKGLFQRDDQGDYWWELRPCDYYQEFEKEKIVWAGVGNKLETAVVPREFFINAPANFLTGNNLYFLQGLLNSKPVVWYYEIVKTRLGGKGGRFYIYDILNLPLPPITKQNQSIVKDIEELVNKILLITQSSDYETNKEKQQKVKELEKEIDKLVYKLYDLTDEEIRIIEESI